jgi:predicted Zn-dependent protease
MSKRLDMLEKMVASGAADSFARYALAMEYRKEERVDDALAAFEALRAKDADYLPMYLMAGQILADAERPAEARTWLEAGVELAIRKGDGKAKSELIAAIDACG